RYLNPPFIRFTTITIIIIGVLNLFVAFYTSAGGQNVYGSWSGGDYSCFYIAGKILNNNPSKLYDFRLQNELLHSLLPKISPTEQLPYVNPPFFAIIFKPLSCLPYMLSYFLWVLISVIIYILAFKLFWKTLESMPPETAKLALLLALSFEPFFMENLFGGNSSVIGFFAFALYLYFGYFKKDLLSGFSLGILLYKPTFLIVILPMLLIARRIKILLGFGICSIIVIFVSVLTVGFDTCIEYMRFIFGVSATALRSEEIFRTWKYIDVFSFSRLLFGTISPAGLILIGTASFVPILFLLKLWWKKNSLNKSSQDLLTASAITLTIIINMHFAIYDSVILVISILLTVDVLYHNIITQKSVELAPGFKALLLLIYISPWISQHMARILGFQLFSLAIAILGIYQISLARTYSRITGTSSG
ncbi:MAG: DUF2029 domain-containing protein, partial [Desulfobacterium sp.]|nr:DUF2029 domain-containing protein [Desulfobacterium sp.]MBU4036697.1 DUF2029 domain-containing protein [Pseudomonadota bacterium]